ncbi:MAG: RNA polymerase sigma factor WhiG [Actinomycetota bacterium]
MAERVELQYQEVASTYVKPAPGEQTPEQRELSQVWREFKAFGSPTVRDKLILHYAPMVKFVAGRMRSGLPSTVEQADLISYGIFGLIDAISKFEPDRAIKFETYAVSRIRGAIIDELRSIDWVPRSVRFKARQLEKKTGELENKLHRAPTDQEVAAAMQISVKELQAIYTQISTVSVAALDELILGGNEDSGRMPLIETLEDPAAESPEAAFEAEEMKEILSKVVDKLPERERKVVSLYYYEGLTLSQIGEVLGVSESRVCQMHTKAVFQLRSRLAEATEEQTA